MSDLAKINREKAKSRGFAALGIPVGSILVFKKDPAVTVKTLDDKNKVEYQGKPYSISTVAKQLVGSPVSGYLYFKFEGKALKSLVKSGVMPVAPESAGSPIPKPVEEAAETAKPSDDSTKLGDAEITEKSGGDIDPLAGEAESDTAESAGKDAEAEE